MDVWTLIVISIHIFKKIKNKKEEEDTDTGMSSSKAGRKSRSGFFLLLLLFGEKKISSTQLKKTPLSNLSLLGFCLQYNPETEYGQKTSFRTLTIILKKD